MNQILIVACALVLASVLSAAPEPLPGPRMYAQQLQFEFASPADAQNATVSVAPVYDNRDWAFSARWDDCNRNSLNMHEHMAKYGLRGTFYLTSPDEKNRCGADFGKQLMTQGCSVGGHSLTHPKFTELKPNAIYYEILANRVEWEDLLDTPLNSFAFPYGQFRANDNPLLWEATTEAARRTGYLDCVYPDFVKDNPYLPAGEISTNNQVVPGDRTVEADKFQENLDKIVTKWPQAYAKQSRCISLGVHAWQAGEEWNKLDAVYETLAHKPQWWYCSHTEWAAYSRQAATAALKSGEAAGATRQLALQRPVPADLGAAVPLTLLVTGADLKAATLAGQPLPFEKRAEVTVLNLPHPPEQALPRKIACIQMGPEQTQLAEVADLPGLEAKLVLTAGQKLALTLQAPPEADLSEVQVTFRLPLQYQPGVVTRMLERVAAGKLQTVELALPAPRAEALWAEGPQYFVAQIDFRLKNLPQRVYVTVTVAGA